VQVQNLFESHDLRKLAEALKARYHTHIGFVDLVRVAFYEDADPDVEPDLSNVSAALAISGISRAEWRRLQYDKNDPRRYVITSTKAIWDVLTPQQQQWLMFDALFSIDADQEGRIRKHDVREHSCIAEHLGVHWRGSVELPDLLGPMPEVLPPPPAGHDEARESY
jgi:hypothetical protein